MKNIIVLLAIFFSSISFAQEQAKALTKEDVPEDVQKEVNMDSITFVVDTQPFFSGGLAALRKEFSQNFDIMALNPVTGNMKTTIYFAVEIDGTIKNAKAVGDNESFNKESERALKAVKSKFSPARVNNLKVRYLMKLPISMNFN